MFKRRKYLILLSFVVAMAVLGAGCRAKWMKKMFRDSDYGVPLEQFTAKNGSYFPKFIKKFFPGASTFAKTHPTIAQARAGLKMIAVKQLNPKNTKYNEANLSWSADGVYLGFEVITGRYRKILLKDLMGNYARDLMLIPMGRNNFLDGMVIRSAHSYNAGLRWSRDSTRFAFMSNGGVGEYNIYVGAVGAKEKAVAKSPTKDGYATWSPKTNEIAFVSGRSGNGDIYMIELNGKTVSRLSSTKAVDIFPEWFPSGQRIVYSSGDSLNHDLHVVERSRRSGRWTKPFPLTKWSRDELRPTVSPDGRYVAFYADSGRKSSGGLRSWNIIVVPFKRGKTYRGYELNRMVAAKDVVIDLNTGPSWSPDSRKLFYIKHDPGVFNPIYGCDLFTGRTFMFNTKTRMNRDILMSKLGVLSFRAQVGVWDRVFVALTNQGLQLQNQRRLKTKIHYVR